MFCHQFGHPCEWIKLRIRQETVKEENPIKNRQDRIPRKHLQYKQPKIDYKIDDTILQILKSIDSSSINNKLKQK